MAKELLTYEEFSAMRDRFATGQYATFNLSQNSDLVFNEVYLKNLETGRRETVLERMAAIAIDVASADMIYLPDTLSRQEKLAKIEERARTNFEMYFSNEFRANTPANINFGRWEANYDENGDIQGFNMKNQLGSACFVIPVEDTFGKSTEELEEGILNAWIHQQMLHKGGGGTGMSFCRLRPKGSVIGYNPAIDGMKSIDWDSTRGVSSGYDSFVCHFFNEATDAVKQGNTRRGANMGIQRIDHMDFLDHIYGKFGRDKNRLEYRLKNFNLSLAVTDEFMEAALSEGTYTLYNPQRADQKVKRVLEKKFGASNPELVRSGDIATKEQFEKIMEKNTKNPFSPVTTPNMYRIDDDVIDAYSGEKIGIIVDDVVRIYASKILRKLSELSHTNGEPGIVFLDRMNEYNPNLLDEEIEATNPCGEQPIPPNDACDLGSINAGKFVKYEVYSSREEIKLSKKIIEDKFTKIEQRKDGTIGVIYYDWDKLGKRIEDSARFLDNLIDRNDFPSRKIDEKVHKGRRIGLGYMGVWDAMVLMKRKYNDEDGYEFGEALAEFLHRKTWEASSKLAEERGEFSGWETSFYNSGSPLYEWFMSSPKTIPDKFKGSRMLSNKVQRERKMNYDGKVRNSCKTTQAPTGTIRRTVGEIRELESSFLGENFGISSGIEPLFSLWEESNILNTTVYDFSLAAVNLLKREGILTKELMEAVKKNRGSATVYDYTPAESASLLKQIPEDVRRVLTTAHEGMAVDDHIKMLSVFQRYNDSAVSKTINLPFESTIDDFHQAWISLWQMGAKGGTIYRDKSRDFQILNAVKTEISKEEFPAKRPLMQNSITLELPYLSSLRDGKENVDYSPDSIFTTIAFNPINKKITGVFQNTSEIDVERLSTMTHANIGTSRNLLKGKEESLDKVIEELERIRIEGNRKGVMVDEAVIPKGSKERLRFQVEGGTTRESLLHALYVIRFLTEDGKNLNPALISEKEQMYWSGQVSLRSIINTQGKLKLEEEKNSFPSILKQKKVIVLPSDAPKVICPECG